MTHSIQAPSSALPGLPTLNVEVMNDADAIRIFIHSYSRNSPHTLRSYAKECGRFLLWLHARHAPAAALLPMVSVQDINAYLDFLANPRPFAAAFLEANGWGQHQPFRKALAKESVRHCLTVLHKMFEAMRNLRSTGGQPYCIFNPTVLAYGAISGHAQNDEIEQALTPQEFAAVEQALEGLPRQTQRERQHYHRARWIIELLYRSFLRREEAAKLTMGAFEPSADGWSLRVVGKGDKPAKIIATDKLIHELRVYRESLGLAPLPSWGETRPAILALTGTGKGKDKGVTSQAIYLICKVIFTKAATQIEAEHPHAAARLRLASPHWMRHTGVTHAMESGVNPRYVQAQARHSNPSTTAKYDHKPRQKWRDELQKM